MPRTNALPGNPLIALDLGILPAMAMYRTCRTIKACGPLLLTNFWTRKGPPPSATASAALPPSAPNEAPVMTRKSFWKDETAREG